MSAREPLPLAVLVLTALVITSACGATRQPSAPIPRSLLLQARPIGRGAAFHPPPAGPALGACNPRLGPRVPTHIEVFAANRVVIVAAGIGAQPPLALAGGRVIRARCYGALVTLDPTGVVLVRSRERLSVADLFRSWGQPLTRSRLGAFSAPAGASVAVFVNGRRWSGPAADVPLISHAEIVLEVGPYVPPHAFYTFPPGD